MASRTKFYSTLILIFILPFFMSFIMNFIICADYIFHDGDVFAYHFINGQSGYGCIIWFEAIGLIGTFTLTPFIIRNLKYADKIDTLDNEIVEYEAAKKNYEKKLDELSNEFLNKK